MFVPSAPGPVLIIKAGVHKVVEPAAKDQGGFQGHGFFQRSKIQLEKLPGYGGVLENWARK